MPPTARGFTLIELLVVLAIMAVASGAVVLGLRASTSRTLEQDADRLIAHLEAARAQARTQGSALHWRSTAQGYVIEALPAPPSATPADTRAAHTWLNPDTRTEPTQWVLPPEPLVGPMVITVYSAQGQLRLATDGLRPLERRP